MFMGQWHDTHVFDPELSYLKYMQNAIHKKMT